jgi:hypothetical protein
MVSMANCRGSTSAGSANSPSAWTDGQDSAHSLVADDARQARAKRVDAADHQQVVEIDRGEFDADQDLAGAWRRGFLDLDEFERLDRIAEGGEVNGTHGSFLPAFAGSPIFI